MKRLLIIALQEMTPDLIDPWVERGLLPNIAALMRAGSSGRVRARAPLTTPHNWANILTGVDAGQHGVFDFWQRGATGIFHETSSAALLAAPIWARLRGTGLSSTLLNLPLTWPPPDMDGVVVAGPQGGPTRELFSTPELYDGLTAAHGAYRPQAIAPGGRAKSDYIGLFDDETPRTARAFEFLLNARAWDFAISHFTDAAMAQHYFWADMEAGEGNPFSEVIASAYRNLDAAIGRLVRAAGRDTVVFVMSECGAGRLRSGIDLNLWLRRRRLLCPRRGRLAGLRRMAEDRLLPPARRILPARVKSALGRSSPTLKNWASSSGTYLDLDWSRTRAFARGKEGNLYVNLAGRDPHGIVQPGNEYAELLDTIERALRGLRDPGSGEPVVTDVARPAELYAGPAIEFAPDLIVDWSDAAYMTTERSRSEDAVFGERWRKGMSWPTTGSHRYDGAVIAAGPGISAGARLGRVSHFDFLPTWLKILGRPVPDGLDGRVLDEIMEQPA
ncbi:MAG: alkaline phosphatase family protein [Gammaproteobacteria bacterium]